MELRHIRYFLAVAEAGHFTRAAAALGIAQPPLSQQIRALEAEIGAALFHRVPRGAELTSAGIAFLPEARATLAAADRALVAARRAHRGESGQLLLGFTTSATYNPQVSGVIDAFHRAWPDVALSLEELSTTIILRRLVRGDLDGGFIRPSEGLPVDGCTTIALPDEATVIALPANHELATHERLSLADVAGEKLILFPRQLGPSLRDAILAAFAAAGHEPTLGQEAQRMSDTINLVAAHLGISIVPRSMTQVRLAGVTYREIEGPAPVARLAMAFARHNRSAVLRNFLAQVRS